MHFASRITRSCSRQRVFLSYSSEDRAVAESIAQALTNAGHKVFFDKSSLPPGSDYNDQIRKAVSSSDRFVFLASRSGLAQGKYTRTELDFAQQRWPSPVGRVYPVLVDPQFNPAELPAYLRSVHCLSVSGSAAAEVLSLIEQTSPVKSWCWACLVLSFASLAIAISLAVGLLPLRATYRVGDVALVAPEYAHFRPRSRPPDDPSKAASSTDWVSSPVTLTLPIAYSHKNAGGAAVQLHREQAGLQLGPVSGEFVWTYVVEVSGSSVSAAGCNDDWLCRKSDVSAQNLRPGETTGTRETMFLSSADQISWARFIDSMLADDGPDTAMVTLRSVLASGAGASGSNPSITAQCRIDVAGSRRRMLAAGFRSGFNPRPVVWQPRCIIAQ